MLYTAHIVHSCQQYCSIVQQCYTRLRVDSGSTMNNELETMWAAQHCCILFSTTLNK